MERKGPNLTWIPGLRRVMLGSCSYIILKLITIFLLHIVHHANIIYQYHSTLHHWSFPLLLAYSRQLVITSLPSACKIQLSITMHYREENLQFKFNPCHYLLLLSLIMCTDKPKHKMTTPLISVEESRWGTKYFIIMYKKENEKNFSGEKHNQTSYENALNKYVHGLF